jgi:two-component sensor histidine kinase
MALSIHELATNAAKYGALSTPEGSVRITWGTETSDGAGERQFLFTWEETAPPVVEPDRKGFGTRLIMRVLAADFEGDVRMEYHPQGVVCILTSPAAIVANDAAEHQS